MRTLLPSVVARFFCYGIAAGAAAHAAVLVPVAGVAAAFAATGVAVSRSPRSVAFVLGTALAWARFDALLAPLAADEPALRGTRSFEGTAAEIRDRGDAATMLLSDIVLVGGRERRPVDGTVTVSLDRYAAPVPHGRIAVTCSLRAPDMDGPFAAIRIRDHIRAVCFDPSQVGMVAGPSAFFRALNAVRDRAREGIDRALPAPHAELAAGLLLGGAISPLPDDRIVDFRRTGMSHIVAASGYNVSVAVFWFLAACRLFPLRRRTRLALAIPVAWGYALLAGADPPVLRAAAMATAVFAAKLLGRASFPLHALVLAAGIMLAADPTLLLFDIGFELSLAATAGLLLLGPRIRERMGASARLPFAGLLVDTLAATFATLPVIVWRFGTVSLISPVANLLILPAVPAAMAATAFAAVPGALAPTVAPFVGLLAWIPLSYILGVTRLLARIPGASVAAPVLAPFGALLLALAVFRRGRRRAALLEAEADGWVIKEEALDGSR